MSGAGITPRDLPALGALLAGVVDYAGLFPPAALDMPAAVASYASYLASDDAWMLGAFVVPAVRLEELARARDGVAREDAGRAWRLSVLAGADLAADVARVAAFEREHGTWAAVDAIELRLADRDAIARQLPAAAGRVVYVELPVRDDPRPLLEALRAAGARAKIRTGGVTVDAFPTSAEVARFLARCVELALPFKATAGLHHPLRGDYPLTYAADAARGTMFGYLNVFLAAAFLRAGLAERDVVPLLEERDRRAIAFDAAGVAWRGHRLTTEQIAATRALAARSFGSCSFREPVDDLRALAIL